VSPGLEAALEAIPTASTTVSLYFRHVYIPQQGPPDPFRVKPREGRWGTEWTLHTAEALHVVLAEYCRQAARDVARSDPTGGVGINPLNLAALARLEVPSPLPARALFRLTFRFGRLADLATAAAREALRNGGFDPAKLLADDYEDCQQLAQAGQAVGWEALRAPSAAWRPDGYCVAVFAGGKARLVRHRLIAPAARPTVAVAYVTTYKTGQRPGWL
jgi:hypothetical protein